jgi:uncharacterized protein
MPHTRHDFPHPVEIIENIWIPLPDGIRLAAKVWRPKTPGTFPAILEYLPYRKRDGTRTRDQGMLMYLAGHGYACIRLDIRGTGDSDGLITDEYTEQEQIDGVDAISWIASQDWCNGQVTMIGISWGGFNGLQIAARQPPALKTVITVGSTDDRYATDVHYIGGCLSKDNIDWSATMFATNDMPPDPEIVGEKWRDMWLARLRNNTPWGHIWLKHQRRDAYWKQGSVCENFAAITIPVYAVSGWADNYSESIPRLLAGLSGPRLGLIGPWAHSFPYDVTVEPAIGWLQEVLRWCDHWMKGEPTGIMNEPMLRVWMQDSVQPKTCYTERPGRWVGETAWPSPRIETQTRFLNSDHDLSTEVGPAKPKSICSPLGVGNAAGEIGRYGENADWPTDQREDDGGSLVFMTEPLAARCEILGAPKLHVTFACGKHQALLAVRLNDVAPGGASTRVTIGLLNLTHRNSHEFPEALVPGETYTAIIELDDIAHAFPEGHRIAVSISTTYWPIAWPSPELATVTVFSGKSYIELPVRPFNQEDENLRPFNPPEAAPQTPTVVVDAEQSHPRSVTRDLLTGKITVDFPRWTYSTTMPDIATTQASKAFARYEITDGDPLSATTLTGYDVILNRPDAVIGHHSTCRMTCTATHFVVETQLRATENGTEIFKNSWVKQFERDHV